MTWYQLWKRLGKQPLHNIQNKNIEIEDGLGNLHKGRLEYYDNGSNFKLVIEPEELIIIKDEEEK